MSTYASMTSASSSLPSASLLAWPPRSLPRSGHSSNSLDELRVPGLYALDVGSSTTPSRRSPFRDDVTPVKTSPKGKARALNPTTPEVRVTDSDRVHDSSNQDVSPLRRQFTPSKPLTPRQLGRIAQSFGIVIPALPMSPNLSPILPSGSPASASRSARDRNLMQPAIRPSPFLLVVVPPLCMLPSSSSGSAADAKDRQKRWKRGRLLPLQPTLGSMMLCIARDYGLPSTAGIGIYLVQRRSNSPGHTRQSSASSSASSFHETGPLISPHAWSTLFSTYSVQASIPSRSSTPSHTPLKGSGPLERDIAFPTSPLSLLAENRPETLHRMRSFPVQTQQSSSKSSSKLTRGHSSKLSSSSAASLNDLPPDPIVGTIEFEIDLDEATWFEEWRQSGGASRRKGSSTFEGPMKELRLVKKIKKDKPRFAEMDRNLSPTPRESAGSGDFAATMLRGESLSALSDESQRQATPDVTFTSTETDSLTGIFPSTDDLPALSLSHTNSRRPIVHIYEAGDAISASASMSFVYPDSEDVHDLLSANTDELLASPILLDVVDAERKRALKEALDKRGSALMMSEQLDDLEKSKRFRNKRSAPAERQSCVSFHPGRSG